MMKFICHNGNASTIQNIQFICVLENTNNWILLKQVTVSGSGISWARCKSAPRSRQKIMYQIKMLTLSGISKQWLSVGLM